MKKTLFKLNKKRLCAFLSAFCILSSFAPVVCNAVGYVSQLPPNGEDYAVVNVAEGKTATTSAGKSLSGWTDGVLDVATVTAHTENKLETANNTYAVLDLGTETEIVAIQPVMDNGAAIWHYRFDAFYGTNDLTNGLSGATKLFEIVNEDALVINELTSKRPIYNVSGTYRYILVRNATADAFLQELFVYAKKYDAYGDWVVRDDAGNKYFEMDYTPAHTQKNYKMIITGYDENGYMTIAPTTANVTSPKMSGYVTPAITDTKFQAVIVNSNDYEVARPIKYEGFTGYSQDNGTATDFVSAITYSKKSSSAEFAGKSVSSSDYITVKAVKSETEDSATVFAGNPTLYWFGSTASGNGYKFEIPFNVDGLYHICVTRYTADKTAEHRYFKYRYVAPTTRQQVVTDTMTGDADTIKTKVEYAMNTLEVIDTADIAEPAYLSDLQYFNNVKYTRDMLYTQEEAQAVTEVSDMINLLNAAAVVNSLFGQDQTKIQSLISTYGSLLGTNLDTSANIAYFKTIFDTVSSTITDSEKLKEALLWSGMLSYMYGTNDEKAAAMRTYETQLGINLSVAQAQDVSLERVASYMTTNVASLYGQTNFVMSFNNAVNAAAEDMHQESDEIVNNQGTESGWQTPSFGGGGGGGGSRPPKAEEKPEEKPVETPEVVNPQPTITAFSDMDKFQWAGEAVNALVEKNVLSGYEDGTFLPEKPVTRAEFIKMLVAATEIEVVEKKDMSFIDVKMNSWYYPYIKIAYTNGICSGVSDYEFNPDGLISRQDMAVLIYNFMEHASLSASGESKEFTDTYAVSEYAKEAVIEASRAGIINGFEDGSFRPRDNARRVDAAMMISKIMK